MEIPKALLTEPVILILHKDRGTVILAGLVEDVLKTGNDVQSVINRITQKIQREKGSMTDEISMAPSIYEIVMIGGLEQEIRSKFPEMELSYHSNGQKLLLCGLKQEVLESKSKILQEVLSLKRRMVEMHPSALEFLTKRDQEELTRDLFLSNGIGASLEIRENQVLLVAKTESSLKESEDQIKAVLNYKSLDIEDPSVLRKAEWQDLITELDNTFNSPIRTVLINTLGSQVVVSGYAETVDVILEQLSDFVQHNSIIATALNANKIVVRFIQELKKQDWFEIVKNKVNVDFKDDNISLSGPRVHITPCKLFFENMISSIHHCKLKVVKPGAKKFFKSKETMYVAAARQDFGCLIELVDENEVFQAGAVGVSKKTVLTPEGVEIVVSKGDMCFYQVDAVVNAANENLDLNKGLSKALSDAAGPQLLDACHQIIRKRQQIKTGDAVLTKAGGRLCCKHIIHAVGPHYDSSNPQKAVGLLKKAVHRSLNIADRENFQSMAISAISSGNLGFPIDLSADTIVGALKDFFELASGDCCLKKVHLVDNNDKTVKAFQAAVQKVYGGSSISQGNIIASQSQQNINMLNSSSQDISQSIKTKEGLTITLSKCNIQGTSVSYSSCSNTICYY